MNIIVHFDPISQKKILILNGPALTLTFYNNKYIIKKKKVNN